MSNSDQNTIEAAISAGKEAQDLNARHAWAQHPDDETVSVPIGIAADGSIEVLADVMAALDARMPEPAARENTATLHEVESFNAYVKRYADEPTLIYANVPTFSFVAVFDDHPPGKPSDSGSGWRRHRAIYNCPRSPEWLAWTAIDGKAMKQDEFADFIEGRLEDLITAGEGYPKPTEVLMVARQLNIRTKGEFRREVNPTNGDHVLVRKLETTSDSTQIPRAFIIGVPVFEGGARYQVEARIRMALGDHGAAFAIVLHRRKEIERDAFNAVRSVIASETGRLILAGTP